MGLHPLFFSLLGIHMVGSNQPLILVIIVTDRNTWITKMVRFVLKLEILVLFPEFLDGHVLTVVVDYVTKV